MAFKVKYRDTHDQVHDQTYNDDASFKILDSGALELRVGTLRHIMAPWVWIGVEEDRTTDQMTEVW